MTEFSNQQLVIDDLPKVEELFFQQIENKYKNVLYLNAIIWAIFLVAGLVAVYMSDLPGLLFVLATAFVFVLIGFSMISIPFIVKNKAFAIRENDISYKTGWIFKKWTTISFNRIQHSEVGRSAFDRIFNLASLQIYSAGGSSSDIRIPGLKVEVAHKMKNYILEKTSMADEEE